MRLARESRQGDGNLVEARANVRGGGAGVTATIGMPRVLAGHSVAEIPLNPRQRRVSQPVRTDRCTYTH